MEPSGVARQQYGCKSVKYACIAISTISECIQAACMRVHVFPLCLYDVRNALILLLFADCTCFVVQLLPGALPRAAPTTPA